MKKLKKQMNKEVEESIKERKLIKYQKNIKIVQKLLCQLKIKTS